MTKKRERVKPRKRSILTNQKPRLRMNYPNQEPIILGTTTATAPPTASNNTTSQDHESIDFTTFLSLDRFNSTSTSNNNHPHPHHHHTPCVNCGCPGSSSSNKYCSPDPPQDQLPKKLFVDPKETTTATTTNVPSIHGFSKIALAPPSLSSMHNKNIQSQGTDATFPVLRRCSSDPCSPPVANLVPGSPPQNSDMAGSYPLTTSASKRSASLPPRPPMRRSVSNPSPDKRYSLSSSSSAMGLDEGSSCQWLRRMKDSMDEINQLWDETMFHLYDEDDYDEGTEENTMNDAIKSDSGGDCEEAVSVEKTGECMILRFKCPCGKGNQILLSGGNCYYKLM